MLSSSKKMTLHKNPLVTVVTPTYNRAGFLKETIESVLKQDFENFEYIILDDGSKDNTLSVVKPFLKDKRVKYLFHENEGEAKTVNWGWRIAQGKYFAIVNSDDPVKNNFLSTSVKTLEKNPNVIMSYADWERIDQNGKRIAFYKNKKWNLEDSLRDFGCYPTVPGTLINKSNLKDVIKLRKGKYKYFCDTDSYWDLALKGEFIYIPKLLASHRWHTDNLSTENSRAFVNEMIAYLKDFYSRKLPDNLLNCEYNAKLNAYNYANTVLSKNSKEKRYSSLENFLEETKIFNKPTFHPLVSIVIPVYNGSNFVKEAIDSALAQTYDNIEVIVVNDGSTDNTEEIVKSYGDKVRYFSKENGGVSTALNLAIKKSKGDYISWLSHDDVYYPDKIEKQIEYLKYFRNRSSIIVFSDYYVNDLTEKKNYVIKVEEKKYFISNNFVATLKMLLTSSLHGCTLLIPKSAFENVGLFDKKYITTQDYNLWYLFLKNKYQFCYINKPLIKTKIHNKQDSRLKINIHLKEVKELNLNAYNLFKDKIAYLNDSDFNAIYEIFNNKKIRYIINDIEKLRKEMFCFSNLQISDNDLMGNKFNGHDLHKYLRESGIDSKQLVWNKESDDIYTYAIARNKQNRENIKQISLEFQNSYCLDSVINPISYDILYDSLFLESDLVHFHLIQNYLLDLNILPILSRLKPLVWTFHNLWPVSGHCVHPGKCNKWKKQCSDCPNLDTTFKLSNDNTSLNFNIKKQAIMNSNFDIIVASEWMKKRVVLSPIYSGKKIHLIPFGINQEIFKKVEQNVVRKKLGIPNNAFVIFFRYNDEYSPKGSNYIDYALSKIKTNKKVYVISVDKKVIKRRKDFVYKEFGWITDDYLLADLYCASDLFLMPSIEESFGMMAAEAMSCGLLPIVLDDTALPEIVNSPTCGVSIKRDEKEYAKNVQYYIDNDNERIKKAKNCYIFAKSKYNKDVYIEKIIKLYREVMKNHHQDDETKNLLNQLKKYMMVDSYIEVSSNLKRESIWWRRMLVVIFYKIDKIFPKNIRKLAKNILIKIDFMKEYFIK